MDQDNKTTEEKNQLKAAAYEGHLDIMMIHALLESLFNIFATIVRLPIIVDTPYPKQDTTAKGEVTALIGMHADSASGSVALSLTLPTVRIISRQLFGEEITSIDHQALDLAGELTNMLVGGAKRTLSEKGYDFDMQTPQLLQGDGHEIVHHVSGQTVVLPITIEKQEFYMELNFV